MESEKSQMLRITDFLAHFEVVSEEARRRSLEARVRREYPLACATYYLF